MRPPLFPPLLAGTSEVPGWLPQEGLSAASGAYPNAGALDRGRWTGGAASCFAALVRSVAAAIGSARAFSGMGLWSALWRTILVCSARALSTAGDSAGLGHAIRSGSSLLQRLGQGFAPPGEFGLRSLGSYNFGGVSGLQTWIS